MPARISGIRACVFDAYGTLFDYGSAAARNADALGEQFAALTALWRDKQTHYMWLRSLQGRHADFWQVTGDALDFSLEAFGIRNPALRERLMAAWLQLDAFPEVADTLTRLKAAGLVTAILSNGTPEMLRAAIDHAGIAHLVDHILSAESVGVFKTHPDVYRLCVDRLGMSASAICFQSSNAWDAWGASAFGMRVVWCNRTGAPRERLPGAPDVTVTSLAELPALVGPTGEAS